jgi:hypothetical protein
MMMSRKWDWPKDTLFWPDSNGRLILYEEKGADRAPGQTRHTNNSKFDLEKTGLSSVPHVLVATGKQHFRVLGDCKK